VNSLPLVLVVAVAENGVIGRKQQLPWRIPGDLKHFKAVTMGKPMLMGRKTYESIGRPLPKRRNIVLTRDRGWTAPGVEVIHSPEELASRAAVDEKVFIIGGAEIYSAFLDRLDELLVSHVFENYPGDTRLPVFEHLFAQPEILESHEGFEVRRYQRQPR
jgi:dihydrofolate reductase